MGDLYHRAKWRPVREFNNGFRQQGFNIAPFIRHYIDLNTRFKFFSNLSVSAGKSTAKYLVEHPSNRVGKDELTYYGASLAPGFVFFPTKKLAIEFSTNLVSYSKLKYARKHTTSEYNDLYDPQTNDVFQFGLSTIQPSVGINYHF